MHTTRSHQMLRLLIVAFAIAGMTLAWATVGADAGTARTLEQVFTPTPLPMTGTPTAAGDRIIVIEGPVAAVNINVINIYNFNIVLNPTDPVLQVIQLGDVLRVTGRWDGRGGDDDDDDDDDDDGDVMVTPSATVDPTLTTLTPTIDPTLTTLTPTVVATTTIDPTLTTLTPTATLDPSLPTPTVSATPSNDDDDDDDDGGSNGGTTIVITTIINITFVNVTVVIVDGQVWRDNGDCSGLPAWVAPQAAQNYTNRCSNGGNNGNGGNPGGGGNGGGNGGGGGDDDDDDDGGDDDDD